MFYMLQFSPTYLLRRSPFSSSTFPPTIVKSPDLTIFFKNLKEEKNSSEENRNKKTFQISGRKTRTRTPGVGKDDKYLRESRSGDC